MRWQDAIWYTQELQRSCRVPGLLSHVWGTHTAAAEGVMNAGFVPSDRQKEQRADEYARSHLHSLFSMAEPYYVSEPLLRVIEATALSLPKYTRLSVDLFPSRYGCLLFDRPVADFPRRLLTKPPDRPDLPDTEPAPMSGFAWQLDVGGTDTGQGGAIIVYLCSWAVDDRNEPNFMTVPNLGRVYVGNIPLAVVPWDFRTTTLGFLVNWHNTRIPDEDRVNGRRFELMAHYAVATLLLMSQTITVRTHEPVDRATRKRAQATGWQHEAAVRVVTLRRAERAPVEPRDTPIDWQCRWYVRRHWRTLHRGTPEERAVLVHEHLKGPEDRPIKPPGIRVFAVTR